MVNGLPRTILRLEGVAIAAAALVLYAHPDGSWLLFVLLRIVPDVSTIGYVLGERPTATKLALIWLSHIGIDRALGFGLTLPSGFKDTHLGRLGS